MPKGYLDDKAHLRQRKRRLELNKAARLLGFPTWSYLETALINGKIVIIIKERPALPSPSFSASPSTSR